MSEQLFREVAHPTVRVGSKTWKTVPLSIAAHALALGGLIAVPLMATGALPSPQSVILYIAPPDVPSPPRQPAAPPDPVPASPVQTPNPDAAPTVEPTTIRAEPAEVPRMSGLASPLAPGVPIGLGVPGGLAPLPTQPAPPAPPPPAEPRRVGGHIKEPAKIHDVRPIYPSIALAAKVEGIVIIEATIGRDGSVIDARVLRSVPLLDRAALEAVRQWRFTPTLLNGSPVPVILTVTVNFTLR
jgi:protein TonB